ncbi:MAG: TRAP transporter substrate-binding protein [Desulfosarcinaceae bacterium]
MKKTKSCIVLLSALAFLFTVSPFLGSSEAASDKPIKLTFSTMFPQVHLQAALNKYFCGEIEKRTNGRVKITLYPGGSLTSAPKCFAGVEKGLSDIGMSCPLYVGGRFPVSEIFEMPSNITSGWVTANVYMDLYNKFKPKEYDSVHVLYLHGPGRNVLSPRTGPIRKLQDMKGLVLRASGGAAKVIKGWGATPRAMPMGEAFEALSKGVVEGQFAVPETLKGWKHADVVKYVTIPPVSTSSCQFVVMNKKTWKKLPPDIQKIFTEVSASFPEYHGYVWNYYDQAGIEYFNGLPGRELITTPVAQKQEWEKAVAPVVAKYIKDKTAMGIPAQEIMDYFNERVAYWEARQPSMEKSAAWVKSHLLKK